MAGASLRVGANTSEFTSQMKSMLTQMKLVTSEYKVEAAQAKALGSQTDLLSAKKKELTAKIQLQTEAIKLQEGNLAAQKQKLTELQTAEQKLKEKVAELTAAYEDSVKATGKDSEESKKLKAQLDETRETHAKAENAVKKQEDAIAKNTIKVNESRAALANQQAELKETEDKLESAGNEFGNFGNAVEDTGAKAVSLGDIIKGSIVASAIVGGVKLLADAFKELATNIFNLANDTQTAFNTLATQTGATAEELEEMQSIMDEIYNNNFGEDMDDIARAMATVKQQTGATGKELQNLTEEALLMRDTFDMDVNESVRTANMLMTTFGLTGEQAYSMIAQGAQKGLNKNGDLLDAINEYSVHFDQLGLSAEDMFNMLVNGAESGTFSVDKLGDAVKEFGIRVKDGTASDAFKELGLNVDETTAAFGEGGEAAKVAMQKVTSALFAVEDPIKQNQLGVAMFGTMWEDLGADGVKALTDLSGEVNSTTEALDKINQQKYNDLESTLEGLKRSVQTKLKEPFSQAVEGIQTNLADLTSEISNGGMGDAIDRIAEGFGNLVTKATEVVTAALPKVLEGLAWIADNGETIVSILAGIGAGFEVFKIANTITSLASKFNGLVAKVIAYQAANEGATVAQALFNGVLNANPVVFFVTFITAVVAAIVTFIATNEKARAVVTNVWEAVKNTIGTVVEGIVTFFTETIPNAFNQVIDFVKGNWQGLLLLLVKPFAGAFKLLYDNCEGFRNIINNLVEQIKTAFNGVVTFLKELPSKIWNAIISTVDAIRTWALDLKTAAVEGITELVTNVVTFFSELPNKIAYVIGFCIGHVIQFGIDLYTWATTKIPEFVNSIITFMQQLPGKIWNAIVSAIQKVATWGENMKTQAVTKVTQLITNVINFMQRLPGKIWNAIVGAVTKVATWGENMRSKAVTAATKLINQVFTTLSKMPGKVWSAIVNAVTQVATWGSNLKAKGREAATGLVNAVVKGVSSLPGKMAKIGSNIVSGIWNGIKSGWDGLKNKVSSLASGLLQSVKDALGIKSPSRLFRDLVGKMIPQGIGVGITSEMPTLQKDLTDELQGMTTKVSAEVNPVAAVKKTAKIAAVDGEVNTKKVTKDKDITVIVYTTNITTLDKKVITKEVKKEVVKGITKDQNDKDKTKGVA